MQGLVLVLVDGSALEGCKTAQVNLVLNGIRRDLSRIISKISPTAFSAYLN